MTSPSCLHGVHCPHDSIARNRDTPAASAITSASLSMTWKLGGAERRARLGHRLVAEGDVEMVGGEHRGRHTAEHSHDGATGCNAAADVLDHIAQSAPHRDLADPWSQHVARQGDDDRSRRLGRTDRSKPAGSVLDDRGHVRERLHVVREDGWGERLVVGRRHLDVRSEATLGIHVVVGQRPRPRPVGREARSAGTGADRR